MSTNYSFSQDGYGALPFAPEDEPAKVLISKVRKTTNGDANDDDDDESVFDGLGNRTQSRQVSAKYARRGFSRVGSLSPSHRGGRSDDRNSCLGTPPSKGCLLGLFVALILLLAVNTALVAVLMAQVAELSSFSEPQLANGSNPEVDIASFFSSTSVPCGYPCATLCYGKDEFPECFNPCYSACQSQKPSTSALASYLRKDAVHHAGLTVSNLSRSVFFYTQILGGVEVPNAGGDGWWGNEVQQLLTQKELLQAKSEKKTMAEMQVADLFDNGTDTLAARYISFGGVTIELLDYRARNASYSNSTELPFQQFSSSPTVVNAMHICLRVEDSVDLNEFINTLESVSKQNDVPVICNRIVPVADEAERAQMGITHPQYNAFHVTSGPFEGWALAYCKGPDGEQLEFAQAILKAKEEFAEAARDYVGSRG